MYSVAVFLLFLFAVPGSYQHGRLWEPPGRSTAWRRGHNTPQNENDNELNCGGFARQWNQNGGKCGECGDAYDIPVGQRSHQLGGTYATGTIVKTYTAGQTITVTTQITAMHKGWNEFRLCPLATVNTTVTQSCLDQYLLAMTNGSTRYYFNEYQTGDYTWSLQLPAGVTCDHCVLQWRWHCGNSWGTDDDGTSCTGCGPQENFMGCADVKIVGDSGNTSPGTTPDTTTTVAGDTTTTVAPTTTAPTTTTTTQTTTTSPVGGDCVWIGGGSGTDAWCNENCNAQPPYCPPDMCECNDD